jgi:SAM-dependent methyltransferase
MRATTNNRKILQQAYAALAPYSQKNRWEFTSNLVHLNIITRYVPREYAILDAGCGLGILAVALRLAGYEVEGSDKYIFENNNDFSVADIARLQELWAAQGLRVWHKDIIVDDFEKQYGAIISIATIEHQKYPKLFLEKLRTAISAGGYLYLATPNVTHLLNRLRFLCGKSPFNNLQDFFEQSEHFIGHWREYTLNDLKRMLTLAGFEVIVARNVQDKPCRFAVHNLRDAYVNALRLCAYALPGAREANIILGKKISAHE